MSGCTCRIGVCEGTNRNMCRMIFNRDRLFPELADRVERSLVDPLPRRMALLREGEGRPWNVVPGDKVKWAKEPGMFADREGTFIVRFFRDEVEWAVVSFGGDNFNVMKMGKLVVPAPPQPCKSHLGDFIPDAGYLNCEKQEHPKTEPHAKTYNKTLVTWFNGT